MKRTIIAVISIVLIAFAFTACRQSVIIPFDPVPGNPNTPTPEPTPANDWIDPMSEDVDISVFFDGEVSDIQRDVKIASTGEVTGTFVYTTAKSAWGVSAEESGYYFLFTVDNDGKEFTTTVEPENEGNNNATVTEPDKAVFLGATAEDAANKKITVKLGNETMVMTFKTADFQRVRPMSEDTNIEAFFDGSVSDIQSNVKIASTGEVTGTFAYTTAKSAWGVPAEESGYYFLFTVDNDSKEFTTTVDPANTGNNNATVTSPDKAVFLGATAEDAANKKVTITFGNDETITMTFKAADFTRVKSMAETVDISELFDNSVSDIQSNVKIASTGEVVGMFEYTTAKDAWGVDGEESGYYFLFTVDNDNEEFTTTVDPANAGNNNATVTDPDKVVFLGATQELAKAKKITVSIGSSYSFTMTFEKSTFEPEA